MIVFRHQDIEKELTWNDTKHLNELVVENPAFLRRLLKDLTEPGEVERKFGLTLDGDALKFDKDIDVVFNPLRLDFNNRRAMTTLLKLLVKTSISEDFYLETGKLKSKIIQYLDKIVDAEEFEFEVMADDFVIDSIAKAVNIHIVGDEDDFVELLTDYIAMMAELTGIKLFVFVNLRSLLDDEELKRLQHNLDNHQADVLLVEGFAHGGVENISRIVIDADQCEI